MSVLMHMLGCECEFLCWRCEYRCVGDDELGVCFGV